MTSHSGGAGDGKDQLYLDALRSGVPPTHPRRRRLRLILLAIGVGCILGGIGLLAGPAYDLWHRSQNDQAAISGWQNGGSAALAGPYKGSQTETVPVCGSASSSDFALVQFNDPASYHYVGVAGNGNWDMLHDRSMVHYVGTPDPGQAGNVIVAFHREPNYEHIDLLGVGGTVTIQDRNCKTFTYKVVQRWDLPPDQVSQLSPTSGHDLTLITCNPWYVDQTRLVWRATLIA